MNSEFTLISSTLAAIAGIFLLVVLLFCLAEGGNSLESIGRIVSVLDLTLDAKRKRHITGGVLLSISLLFGGLAFTVITIKKENVYERH